MPNRKYKTAPRLILAEETPKEYGLSDFLIRQGAKIEVVIPGHLKNFWYK